MSPAGELIIGSYDGKLCLCDWNTKKQRDITDKRIQRYLDSTYEEGCSDIIERTISELDEYFAGFRKTFDIPVIYAGTGFQRMVWDELTKIPYGTTITYGELAGRIHKPKAVRAVASANAANAIPIIVPCHRVIGSGNRLTGYSGGLDAKKILLRLEHAWPE